MVAKVAIALQASTVICPGTGATEQVGSSIRHSLGNAHGACRSGGIDDFGTSTDFTTVLPS